MQEILFSLYRLRSYIPFSFSAYRSKGFCILSYKQSLNCAWTQSFYKSLWDFLLYSLMFRTTEVLFPGIKDSVNGAVNCLSRPPTLKSYSTRARETQWMKFNEWSSERNHLRLLDAQTHLCKTLKKCRNCKLQATFMFKRNRVPNS